MTTRTRRKKDVIKDATLQTRLPAELFEEFKKITERDDRTPSSAIRLLVRDFVEKHKARAA